jgi:competence protein ComEC
MLKFFSAFKFLALTICVLSIACSRVNVIGDSPGCTFTIVDVGQGLSQIGVVQGTALVWDIGDSGQSASWQKTYERLGSPRISAIVISHTHVDHMGGLSKLPPSMSFSGQIITHPNEDTAYIRWRVAKERQQGIYFTFVSQGDTIPGLEGVHIECIWPLRDIGDSALDFDTLKNRYSLCFLLRYGATTAFITSDIDTAAQRELSMAYGFRLKSDIMVVPHHGSARSADEVFYGYVNPSAAVISCAEDNSYGFPSAKTLNLIYQMRIEVHETAREGSVMAFSNGFYWKWR